MGYPSDLNDTQWNLIKHLFENKDNRGKHLQTEEKRNLVNAVLYINKTGCQWRYLPNDFPHYVTVSSFYHRAKERGIWDKIRALLVRKARLKEGRTAEPSYGLIDSQSTKTTGASEERGYDGGKKNKRAQKAYCYGHNGKSVTCQGSCG